MTSAVKVSKPFRSEGGINVDVEPFRKAADAINQTTVTGDNTVAVDASVNGAEGDEAKALIKQFKTNLVQAMSVLIPSAERSSGGYHFSWSIDLTNGAVLVRKMAGVHQGGRKPADS